MNKKYIYQTLEDRNNADYVERDGPFKCTNKPWLGNGYYFWDTFIELAHWWGRQGYNDNYIICQAFIDKSLDDVLDLVGNTEQMKEFKEYVDILKRTVQKDKITVAFVIEYMKKTSKEFPYKAIRANFINSIKTDKNIKDNRLPGIPSNTAYLDTTPSIQICIIDKSCIATDSFEIIYPEAYSKGYTI